MLGSLDSWPRAACRPTSPLASPRRRLRLQVASSLRSPRSLLLAGDVTCSSESSDPSTSSLDFHAHRPDRIIQLGVFRRRPHCHTDPWAVVQFIIADFSSVAVETTLPPPRVDGRNDDGRTDVLTLVFPLPPPFGSSSSAQVWPVAVVDTHSAPMHSHREPVLPSPAWLLVGRAYILPRGTPLDCVDACGTCWLSRPDLSRRRRSSSCQFAPLSSSDDIGSCPSHLTDVVDFQSITPRAPSADGPRLQLATRHMLVVRSRP
ncbi:hypothetical protein SCHPADRAFT_485693 [Schizopora paradoxa]|uniref:Uncharacterized protein n=1 Tax=Schizopora paradoxa TaxID=27342 RepID=A0A0H2RH12_9AGAM|nr:hypothetical protein SCHPADRAFT_485693 [Schizopora paradoxa]